jgi:hypothetical protein
MINIKFKREDIEDLIETFELLKYMSYDKETKKANKRSLGFANVPLN